MSVRTDEATERAAVRERFPQGTVVAIGKFEGLHLGHRAIIRRVQAIAAERGLGAVILTFRNNPLSFLSPENCPRPVMSPEQRRDRILQLGIDHVSMLDFDAELANRTPREFVESYLIDMLGARVVIIGDDFKFGATASGTSDTLVLLGDSLGFEVEVMHEVADTRVGRVSSTKIREMLTHGDVAGAARLLEDWHFVRGVVTHGDARGRTLGFPTANLGPHPGESRVEGFVPGEGVYAGFVDIDGERHPAAISVGNNPTFTPDAEPRVESFLLDFSGDLYDKVASVVFVERIRGNVRFDGVDALVEQMTRDVETTREILANLPALGA